MKKLFVVLIAVLVVSQAWGQVRFGVKAGANFASENVKVDISGAPDITTKMIVGFNAGLILDATLVGSFGIQPGVLFTMKGTKFDNDYTGKYTETVMGIEVPINAMYKLNVGGAKILIFAGPYLGYAFAGKDKASGESTDIKFGSGSDQMNALDYGINFGAGAELGSIQVTAQYGLGLANLYNMDQVTVKNNVIGLSVAYLFGGK